MVVSKESGVAMSYDHSSTSGASEMLLMRPGNTDKINTSAAAPAGSELLPPTRSAIERFARRRAQLQFCRGVAIGTVSLVVGMLLLVVLDYFRSLSIPIRTIGTVAVDLTAIAAAWFFGVRQSRQRDWIAIAQSMESLTPPLRERLLPAVELEDPRYANGSVAFRSALQSGVAGELASINTRAMLPWRLVRGALFSAIGAITFVGLLSSIPDLQLPRRLARAFAPIAPIERASFTQISITAPQPASRSVAQGDLIAVTAEVSRLRSDVVELQWQSEDGRTGRTQMTRRGESLVEEPVDNRSPSANAHVTDAATSFAANLEIDQSVVHYRVLAGDAETNWHTLIPMPRPRVVAFEKQYHFPVYAKLPDVEVVEEHGDLEALVGTRATVNVEFDQPVRSAQVWFGDSEHDAGLPMQMVDDDPTQFRFEVAIQTPGSYRVDGTSLRSELNNPFLPRSTIDPVIDRSPTAVWAASIPVRQIASSAAVLTFPGRLDDDLPMDRYVIESIVDDGPIRELVIGLNPATTDQEIHWKCDLSDLRGNDPDSDALPAGTLLRMRLVALDRIGRRGESDWRFVYIAEEQFDPNRHDSLFAWQALSRRMNAWFAELQDFNERLRTAVQHAKDHVEDDAFVPDQSLAKEIDQLSQQWQEIAGTMDPSVLRSLGRQAAPDGGSAAPTTLAEIIFGSTDSVTTDQQSLLDRFATTTLIELRASLEAWGVAAELGKPLDGRERKHAVDTVARAARQAQGRIKQVSELPSQILARGLAEALIRDWDAIDAQTEMLVDEDSSVPIDRLPGQANLLAERFRQLEEFVAQLDSDLPAETQRHLQNFRRFLNESIFRIQQANDKLQLDRNPDVAKNFRDAIRLLLRDMRNHHAGSFVHGNTFNRLVAAVRDMSRADQQTRATIDSLNREGQEWKVSNERLNRDQDQEGSEAIAPRVAQEKYRNMVFMIQRDALLNQYDRAEARERIRPDMQVFIASDFNLVRRVIEHVTESGFQPIGEEQPDQLFKRISEAAIILEAGGQLIRFASQLNDIADRERFGKDQADRAIGQGMRLEHYQAIAETPLQQLRAAEIDNKLFDDLQATRWDADFSQAREWTTRRRYDSRPFVSAAAPVQALASRYRAGMPVIQAAMAGARETLRAFLPTTSELAEAAADAAKQQQGNMQDAANPSIGDLQEKVDRLASDLVDRANAANLSDNQERELARDADAALQKIEQQMAVVAEPVRQPEKGVSPADAMQNLEQLTQTLETTAAHFAAAEAGAELSQTRQELRENVQPDALEAARQDALRGSDVAQASPEELLRQLERQLKRDPPMQTSLSEISRQTVSDVESAVRAAAGQETRIQRELERADPQLDEQKKRLRDQLRSLSDQSRAVNDQWLNAAERASGQDANAGTLRTIRELRQELRSATDQADGVQHDEALLSEIQSAAQQLHDTLQHAAEKSGELKQEAERLSTQESHPNDRNRNLRAKQLENDQRRTQNEWIKALGQQVPQWRQRRDEAGRRVQQAEQQKREAEKQLSEAERKHQEKPDEEWSKKQAEETRQRVDDASRAAKSATATRKAADEAEQQAARFIDEAKKQSVKSLDAKSPTAELLARASEISQREMDRIATELKQLSDQAKIDKPLQPRRSSADSLAKSQSETRQATQQAAEDLTRAARHEGRLGNANAADQLDAAAKELQATSDSPVQQAQKGLQQAADVEKGASRGEQASSAQENLGKAAEQLAEQADALSELAASIPATGSTPRSTDAASQNTGSRESTGTLADADRPEKLARALDELDRALFGSSASKMQDGSGQNAEQSDESSADSQQGRPASKAGEASPTLAEAAQQAARQLAAERQQRLSQIASAGKPGSKDGSQDGDPSPNQPGRPGTQSGDSFQMPSGGLLSIDGELRSDGQWGELRERANDDVIQDRKVSAPLSYRGAIEAYFQTIAGEAARAGGNNRQSQKNPAADGRQ